MATPDPVLNRPVAVPIDGATFYVRELTIDATTRNIEKIKLLLRGLIERHPDVDFLKLGEEGQRSAGDVIIELIVSDLDHILKASGDVIADIMGEAVCDEHGGSVALGDLPISTYVKLLGDVLEAQSRAIQAFFDLGQRLRGILGAGENGSQAPSPKRASSRASSARASGRSRRSRN
ncbi:MAG: hypothetical protein R3344_03435 [Acidobacteriota bacterium]|nr:hypothetical protein [Acidobacteriota bacterium]